MITSVGKMLLKLRILLYSQKLQALSRISGKNPLKQKQKPQINLTLSGEIWLYRDKL
jgi:hypothetical protein